MIMEVVDWLLPDCCEQASPSSAASFDLPQWRTNVSIRACACVGPDAYKPAAVGPGSQASDGSEPSSSSSPQWRDKASIRACACVGRDPYKPAAAGPSSQDAFGTAGSKPPWRTRAWIRPCAKPAAAGPGWSHDGCGRLGSIM